MPISRHPRIVSPNIALIDREVSSPQSYFSKGILPRDIVNIVKNMCSENLLSRKNTLSFLPRQNSLGPIPTTSDLTKKLMLLGYVVTILIITPLLLSPSLFIFLPPLKATAYIVSLLVLSIISNSIIFSKIKEIEFIEKGAFQHKDLPILEELVMDLKELHKTIKETKLPLLVNTTIENYNADYLNRSECTMEDYNLIILFNRNIYNLTMKLLEKNLDHQDITTKYLGKHLFISYSFSMSSLNLYKGRYKNNILTSDQRRSVIDDQTKKLADFTLFLETTLIPRIQYHIEAVKQNKLLVFTEGQDFFEYVGFEYIRDNSARLLPKPRFY